MATYFSESGYKLKYRWSGYDNRGMAVQLDIYQKSSSSFSLTYIGGLKAINLRLQGGQGSVYSPIIKTSLEVTLVDAPDEVASGYKYGNWQEFYTPDSTRYLVKLYRCWEGSSQTLEWQGFITPDSWQESLSYRGSITIVARDNLGHLQDFEFDGTPDKYGLIQIFNGSTGLLDLALSKISFPMNLAHNTSGDAKSLRDTNGNTLIASKVNARKFQGQDWYHVIESVLEAIGYCLRFVGGGFVLQPIRNLPLTGYTSRSSAHAAAQVVEFYGGDRSNDPAYMEIKDIVDYDSQDEISYDIHRNLTYGSNYVTYNGKQISGLGGDHSFTGRACSNTNSNGETQGGWLFGYGYGFINPADCVTRNPREPQATVEDMEYGVPLAADQAVDGSLQPTYRMACLSTDVTIICEFARPMNIKTSRLLYSVARLKDYMAKAKLYIKYTDPQTSTVYYWNGSGWQTSSALTEVDIADTLAESYSFEVALADIGETAALGGWLDIGFANFLNYGDDAPVAGSFVRLTAIKAQLNTKSVLKSDTVTTINSADYNVKIQRKPELGAMSAIVDFTSPANYLGALWEYDSNGIPIPHQYANYWNGYSSTTAIPLPAQIHKQILCFNHVSLQMLEGQMGSVTKSDPLTFSKEVYYKDHYFIIQTANLDVLHNRMNGVNLHEYVWYDSLWNENNNPTYSGVPVFDTKSASGNVNGTGSRAGGSSSGGGGGSGGGGTVTSVGMNMPTGFSVSGSPITTSGTIQVAFANGYSLPTTAKQAQWDAAYGWGDHSQAGYGTVKSVGLTVPTGFVASNTPITDQGNIVVGFQAGYSLPQTVDVSKGVTAFTWGDHAEAGYLKAITYNMVVQALGFAPAEYADVNALGTRMDNAESDIDELQAAIGGSKEGMLYAPKVRIFRGYNEATPDTAFNPFMRVEHPLLNVANLNAKVVLMVWSKRRGRKGATSTKRYPTYVGGWGEVRGKLATNAPLTWKGDVTLDTIRQFVLNKCLCGSYRTEAAMRIMMLSSFKGYRKQDVLFGFKGKHGQSPSDFKAKESRLFGVAIRFENPKWMEYATDPVAETTREIEGEQGEKIKRYIYTDVTPFRIHCNTDFNFYWTLGFQLNPFVGPVKL